MLRRRPTGVSLSLAGWLWADILLGLFAIFLAASAVASAAATPAKALGIDRTPLEFRISVNGPALLSSDRTVAAAEQQRIVADVQARVASERPGRHAAIVFAYGSSERASDGDRMAQLATEDLGSATFDRALVKAYHELVAGDQGTAISFEIYFDE